MKAVILCGGKGERFNSSVTQIPKALVELNGQPLIYYVMSNFITAGVNEFILCGGYLIEKIQQYFSNVGETVYIGKEHCIYKVFLYGQECMIDLFDTGMDTTKANRIRRILPFVDGNSFFVSYCDCICNIEISKLFLQHSKTDATLTVAVVNPISRYGHIICAGDFALDMQEKPVIEDIWINGGYMVLSPRMISVFNNTDSSLEFENDILPLLARNGELAVYRHKGFWKNVESQKDLHKAAELVLSNAEVLQ